MDGIIFAVNLGFGFSGNNFEKWAIRPELGCLISTTNGKKLLQMFFVF